MPLRELIQATRRLFRPRYNLEMLDRENSFL